MNDMHDVWEHPQLKARDRWREVEHARRAGARAAAAGLVGRWRSAHGPRAGARRAHRCDSRASSATRRAQVAACARQGRSDSMRPSPVTYLFVPGNRPERFDQGAWLAAPTPSSSISRTPFIADRKAEARAAVAEWCRAGRSRTSGTLVRINDATTPWFADDLAMLAPHGVGGDAAQGRDARRIDGCRRRARRRAGARAADRDARGARADVTALAGAPGVQRLAFGTLDYALDLDLSERRATGSSDAGQPDRARVALRRPRRADRRRHRGHRRSMHAAGPTSLSRAPLGFGAKLCIHPRQVGRSMRALRAGAERDWTGRAVSLPPPQRASAPPRSTARMVDRPVVLPQSAILDRRD